MFTNLTLHYHHDRATWHSFYLGFRYANSSSQSVGDFYLGRKLGPLVTAMSAEASDMSSWLLMGLPGLAYSTG